MLVEAGGIAIYELTYPGALLDVPADDFPRLWPMMTELEGELEDATLALAMFEAERQRQDEPGGVARDAEASAELGSRIAELRSQVLATNPHMDHAAFGETGLELESVARREQLESRGLPSMIQMRAVFMHARSFVYALSGFEKMLDVLTKDRAAPREIRAVTKHFDEAFPNVKAIRDSQVHREDRALGLAFGKPIPLKEPIVLGAALLDDRFQSTGADGSIVEVSISRHSLEALGDLFQETVDAMPWKGPKRLHPL